MKTRCMICQKTSIQVSMLLTALMCMMGVGKQADALSYKRKQRKQRSKTQSSNSATSSSRPLIATHERSNPRRKQRKRNPLDDHLIPSFVLGEADIWVEPTQAHLSLRLRVARWAFHFVDKNKRIGYTMQVLSMDSERWLGSLTDGDFHLSMFNWGRIAFQAGTKHFAVDAGFYIARKVYWDLSDSAAESHWKVTKQFDKPLRTLDALGPDYMLPELRLKLFWKPFYIEAYGELLRWDLRGFQGGLRARWDIFGSLSMQVSTRYIHNATRFALRSDKKEDSKLEPITSALWNYRAIESQLQLAFDFSSFFKWNQRKAVPWGPVKLVLGIRHREVLEHQLTNLKNTSIFSENPGGYWSIALGLKVGIGIKER